MANVCAPLAILRMERYNCKEVSGSMNMLHNEGNSFDSEVAFVWWTADVSSQPR